MPKQSPKNPVFRCNSCKDFHSANDFPFLYQCPQHGYVCRLDHTAKHAPACDKQLLASYWSDEASRWIEVKDVANEKDIDSGTLVDILIWGDTYVHETEQMKEYKQEKLIKNICDCFQFDETDAWGLLNRKKVKVLKKAVVKEDALKLVSKLVLLGARVYFAYSENPIVAVVKDNGISKSPDKADTTVIGLLLDSFESGKLGKDEFISSLRKLLG